MWLCRGSPWHSAVSFHSGIYSSPLVGTWIRRPRILRVDSPPIAAHFREAFDWKKLAFLSTAMCCILCAFDTQIAAGGLDSSCRLKEISELNDFFMCSNKTNHCITPLFPPRFCVNSGSSEADVKRPKKRRVSLNPWHEWAKQGPADLLIIPLSAPRQIYEDRTQLQNRTANVDRLIKLPRASVYPCASVFAFLGWGGIQSWHAFSPNSMMTLQSQIQSWALCTRKSGSS